MKASIVLAIEFDEPYLIAQASRRGVPTKVIADEVLQDLECRCVDVCRWRDGLVPGGVTSRAELAARLLVAEHERSVV